jgi:competence protein ComEC
VGLDIKILRFYLFLSFLFLYSCNKKYAFTWTAINVSDGIQGDAHLLQTSDKSILIDTGHASNSGTRLLPFLRNHDISKIDAVFISHAHVDHYQGLFALINNNIHIGLVYFNFPAKEQCLKESYGCNWAELRDLKKIIEKKKIPVLKIKPGINIRLSKTVGMEVLYIFDGINTPVGKTDINDMSAVIMVTHGKNRFLFTGDLNNKIGTYIAQNATDIRADVLKVPHHGTESLAPNSFFEKVNPEILIVPSPKGLWESKRSARVRKLARERNYRTYVNGIHGDIIVKSDGKSISIEHD